MTPDRNLKAIIKAWTDFECSDAMADAIKIAIRQDQDEEHLFCKDVIRKKIKGKNVEGHTFNS